MSGSDRATVVLLVVLGLAAFAVTLKVRRGFVEEERAPELQATMRRAAPLLAAIGEYTQRHGHPPPDLTRIVPEYIPCLPEPGPLAKGGWRYDVGKRPIAGGWSLYVMVSRRYSDPTGFGDVFAYHPSGRYEPAAYGGGLERVGTWGYYHE